MNNNYAGGSVGKSETHFCNVTDPGSGITRKIRERFAGLVLVVAAALALAAFGTPAVAQNGTGQIGNVCIDQFVNNPTCRASDVAFEEFNVIEVVESCTSGTLGEAEVVFDAVVVSGNAARYGIGLFINLEGESAQTGDLCLHDFLSPVHPSTNPDDWPTTILGGNGETAFIEPFPNINSDQCGDIPGNNSRVFKPLQQVRIQCNDVSGDGFVDISACASWLNNKSQQCTGLDDAIPGTRSKCGCTNVETGLALPASLTIVKQTTADDGTFNFETTSDPTFDETFSLPADFQITTFGGTGSEDFGGVVEPGTYTIDEIAQAGWRLDSATCTNGNDPQTAGGGVTVGPGDDVTCTFTNSPIVAGSVTIIKNTQGGDGSFGFTGDLGNFTLVTDGGSDNITFTDVEPDTYDVTEQLPAGWDLTGISCSNDSDTNVGTGTASIEVGEDESVSCTFTNTAKGSITIAKATQPAGGEGFQFSEDITPGSFSLDDGEDQVFSDLSAGDYQVAETDLPAGWDLTGISCTGGSNVTTDLETASVDISLNPGEDVSCTFTNTERGSLTVVKDAIGGDDTFDYTSQSLDPASFSIDTSVNESVVFTNLVPATYDVTELEPPMGWLLQDGFCNVSVDRWDFDEVSGELTVQILPGEDVTCTFQNVLEGTVAVTKRTIGGDDEFLFDGGLGQFGLTTEEGSTSMDFGFQSSGQYTIEELGPPAGWTLTDVSCTIEDELGNEQTVSGDTEAQSVTFELNFGDTVNCAFENTADGTIIIEKATDPEGSELQFEFTGDLAGTIGDGGQLEESFQPGEFSSMESVPEGWALTDISCSGQTDSFIQTDLEEAKVDIGLAAGETVTCVFTNTELGSFTVIKATDPEGSEQEFTFTGNAAGTLTDGQSIVLEDLLPGTYTSTEASEDGWSLTGIECEGDVASTVTVNNPTVSVDLAAGEDVVCTFNNSANRSTIVVEKVADPSDTAEQFSFSSNFAGDFDLGAGGSETTGGLLPSSEAGTYNVSETPPEGWTLESASCDNGDDPSEITLDAGETVTCTFTNVEQRIDLTTASFCEEGGIPLVDYDADLTGFEDGETVTIRWIDSEDATHSTLSDEPAAGQLLWPGAELDGDGNAINWPGWEFVGGEWIEVPSTLVPEMDLEISAGDVTVTQSVLYPGGQPDFEGGGTCEQIPAQEPEGTIIVVKQTEEPTEQLFNFVFSGNQAFTLASGGSMTFDELDPGTYSVSETPPQGWTLVSATCDDGSSPGNIILEDGEVVTCTFLNAEDDGPVPVDPFHVPTNNPLGLLLMALLLMGLAGYVIRRRERQEY